MKRNSDFAIERQLRRTDPALHRRFTDAVFALQYNLSNYQLIFPEFTDHTNLHSLTVIDFCNQLIAGQLESFNADELYVLLMGCYFHDTGMGITMKDYEAFSRQIDFGDYFQTHSDRDYPRIIRDFHHEFSGAFIRKYADFFEIPSPQHLQAIIQVARGHRKTDLLDEAEYPPAFPLPNGNTVCLTYLAALIRLADEIDVAAARNPVLLYDLEALTEEHNIIEHKKARAVRSLTVTEKEMILTLDEPGDEIRDPLRRMAAKMQETLDYCRRAVLGRTPYVITQGRVRFEEA